MLYFLMKLSRSVLMALPHCAAILFQVDHKGVLMIRSATRDDDRVHRYHHAKRWLYRRAVVATWIDDTMSAVAARLPLCGEGKKHNMSILFAQLFFTECPCCLFYRGVTVGFGSALLIFAMFFPIFGMI